MNVSDGKTTPRNTQQDKPQRVRANNVNKAYARCLIRTPENKNTKIYEHCLIDNGNLSSEALISETIFRRLQPQGELGIVRRQLRGAGNQMLHTLGSTKSPISIVFRDPKDKSTHEYRLRPIVVRGLAQPILLSNSDLCTLKAEIKMSEAKLVLPHSIRPKPLEIPLFRAPSRVALVQTTQRHVIKPFHETVFTVQTTGLKEGTEVLFEPDISLIDLDEPGLVACATTDKIRDNQVIHCRITNFSDHPVTIKKGQEIGYASTLQDYTGEKEKQYQTVAALTSSPQYKERQQKRLVKDEFKTIKTKEELYKRIWDDLDMDKEDHGLTYDEKKKLVKLFARHRPALCLDYDEVGLVKNLEMRIDTGDAKPVRHKNRQLNPVYRQALREQLQRWLHQDVIEPGHGPWASAIVAIPKKNGGVRFAADYRDLNKLTKRDSRPIANLEERLSKVRGDPKKPIRYFASVDLSEAYHSVPIAESDREKSAIVTPEGLFQFKRMSFGLAAAPAAFHQVVKMIEKAMEERDPNINDSVLLYFDDCLLSGTTFDELLERLEILLEAVTEVGMKIQVRKCNIGYGETKWLGHRITPHGIYPDNDRIRILKDWPTPINRKQVHEFHGLASTFRKFIKNFAHRTRHMRALLKRDANSSGKDPIKWTPECEAEKQDLIKVLTSEPMIGHPDWSEDANPFMVTVDTSSHGTGCTLSQVQWVQKDSDAKPQQREVILYYGSRRLTTGESRYSAYKMELCGILHAVEHFRYYLLGRKFLIRTDHKALEWLRKTTNPKTPQIVFRWQETLSEYDFDILYVPGTKMKLCDALSRRPFNDGEEDNILPVVPKRQVSWNDEPSLDEARGNATDSFWIPVMKKRYGTVEEEMPNEEELEDKKMDTTTMDVNAITASDTANAVTTRANRTRTEQSTRPPRIRNRPNTPTPAIQIGPMEWILHTRNKVIIPPKEHLEVPALKPENTNWNMEYTVHNNPDYQYGNAKLDHGKTKRILWTVGENITVRIKNTSRMEDLVLADGEPFAILRGQMSNEDQEPTDQLSTDVNVGSEAPEERFEDKSENSGGATRRESVTKPATVNLEEETDADKIRDTLFAMPSLTEIGNQISIQEEDAGDCFQNWCRERQQQDEAIKLVRQAQYETNKAELLTNPEELRQYLKSEMPQASQDKLDTQTRTARLLGTLYRKGELSIVDDIIRRGDGNGQIVIPYEDRETVVSAVHAAPGTFHLGRARTYAVARNFFYFSRMEEFIGDYIRDCAPCQYGKRLKSKRGPGLGQTASIPNRRLTIFSADVIPFPPGRGYSNLLTFVDVSTGWLEAFPMGRATGANVARILQERILPRYGEGLVLTVDQGREMTANLVREALEDFSGQIYLTTAYHSNSNPVERHHRTLEDLIRAKLKDEGWPKEKWPDALPEALYTMRCAPDSQTLESPYFRTFGQHPVTRVNRWFGRRPEDAVNERKKWKPDPQPWSWNPADPEEEVYDAGPPMDKKAEQCQQHDHVAWIERTTVDKEGYTDSEKVPYLKIPSNEEPRELYLSPRAVQDGVEMETICQVQDGGIHQLEDPTAPEPPYYAPISSKTQDDAQRRKDEARLHQHRQNKIHFDSKVQPVRYYPTLNELCDYFAPFDEDSKYNRKMASRWTGPFRVIKKPDHEYTCTIRKLDPETLNIDPTKVARRVYCGNLRPSLMLKMKERPRGKWIPPWMPNASTQLDARKTVPTTPNKEEKKLRSRVVTLGARPKE